MSLAEVQPAVGIQMDHVEAQFFARGGNVCEGYIYPLCLLQHAQIPPGTTFDIFPGSNTSVWANVSAAASQAANEGRDGRWILALESALSGTKFRGLAKGIAKAVVGDLANATIPCGRKLWDAPANAGAGIAGTAGGTYHLESQSLTGTGGVARNTIAQALETYATGLTPSDGARLYVYFDGIDGCGFSGETQ